MQAAQLLGRLNSLLIDYKLPIDMGKEWLDKFNEDDFSQFYCDTLSLLNQSTEDKDIYLKIKSDLEFRLLLNEQMPKLRDRYNEITYTASHGDYIYSQLICDNLNIKAIIDFSCAQSTPISLELMRFYALSSSDCYTAETFNIETFKKYISTYMQYFSLSSKDLRNMPYVYLYYLGRNKFTYREYLKTQEKNKIELLRFSSWRTDMCRYLFENAEYISKELLSLL